MKYISILALFVAIFSSCDSDPAQSETHKAQMAELQSWISEIEAKRAAYDEYIVKHDADVKKHIAKFGDTHPVFLHFQVNHKRLFEDHQNQFDKHKQWMDKWVALENLHMKGETDERTMTYDHDSMEPEYSKILEDYELILKHGKIFVDEHAKVYMQMEKDAAEGKLEPHKN